MTLEELVRRSEASRILLTESHARMKHALDFPSRARESLRDAPGKWLGGSLAVGFLTSFLFKRRKSPAKVEKPKHRHGFLIGLLTLAFTMGKPFAKAYALKMLKDYLSARLVSGARERVARGGNQPY